MHTEDRFIANVPIEPIPPLPHHYMKARGTGEEAKEVRRRLGDFNATLSPIGYFLRQRYPGSSKKELMSVAQMIVFQANKQLENPPQFIGKLDRVTRRSLDLIIKWYTDNWGIVVLFINDLFLCDENFRPISLGQKG
jgi:hypothetical protein